MIPASLTGRPLVQFAMHMHIHNAKSVSHSLSHPRIMKINFQLIMKICLWEYIWMYINRKGRQKRKRKMNFIQRTALRLKYSFQVKNNYNLIFFNNARKKFILYYKGQVQENFGIEMSWRIVGNVRIPNKI